MNWWFFKNKKDQEILLILDIGTETVKAIIFQKSNKITILAECVEYFERELINGKGSEIKMIKETISKTIKGAIKNLSFSLIPKDLKKKIEKQKKWRALITISADILKARVIEINSLKKNPKERISKKEEGVIYKEILEKTKKELSKKFARYFGIIPADIYCNSLKITEIKIDGYSVPTLCGYKGKNLQFNILTTFLPTVYLENIKKIAHNLKIEIINIVHPAESLSNLISGGNEGLFIDIGGGITQFFLVEDGKLRQVDEFKIGGETFSEVLSDDLGVDEETARLLKEKYSDGLLSGEASQKIKKIFDREQKKWYLNLKSRLRKLENDGFLISNIYLFGGGSLLPEIKEILEDKMLYNLKESVSSDYSEIKIIYPKYFKNIENLTVGLKSPQIVPPLIICDYAK